MQIYSYSSKNNRQVWQKVSFLGVCLALVGAGCLFHKPKVPVTIRKQRDALTCLYYSINLYVYDHKGALARFPLNVNVNQPGFAEELWTSFREDVGGERTLKAFRGILRLEEGRIVDQWGRPVIIVGISMKQLRGCYKPGPVDKKIGRIFLVWSVGPNGKNEGGSGDDIAVGLLQSSCVKRLLKNELLRLK